MRDIIYFDNAATTKPIETIVNYINKYTYEFYGNPSSLHYLGLLAEKEVTKSRNSIANVLGCKTNEIIFTSSGTESNNLAIRGYLNRNKNNGKKIITTKIEHASVKYLFESLGSNGYDIAYIENNNFGLIDLEMLENTIDSDTALVSIMHVNNEIGSINDIKKIGNIIKRKNRKTIFHVDAVQSFLKINMDVQDSKVDLMSISAHKIHGLKGVGALYKREGVHIEPLFYGGGQEQGIRSGTENTLGIATMGIAIEENNKSLVNIDYISELNMLFRRELEKMKGAVIISPFDASPFILNVAFPKIPAETMIHFLESKALYASAGAACSSKKNEKSHVLKALRLPDYIIDSSVRFSFCYNNNVEEVKSAIIIINEAIETLGKIYR